MLTSHLPLSFLPAGFAAAAGVSDCGSGVELDQHFLATTPAGPHDCGSPDSGSLGPGLYPGICSG